MTDTNTDDGQPAPSPAQDRIASAIVKAITTPLTVMPGRGTISRKLFAGALKKYHDIGGGDAIGLIAEPGQQLDVRPIKYRPPKDCEEAERPGWVEKGGDKVWHAGAEGRVVDYLGRTPIVALERDGHVEAGWLKPRIGQAIELDNYDPLFTNPEITAEVDVTPDTPGTAANSAIPDGGTSLDIGIESLGRYDGAEILDLDSGEGYDGMRVDFRKASAWAFEQTTTEEMQMQEERGWLRGKISGSGTNELKVFIYAALFALAVIAVVTLGPGLINGGGGGGGGSLPSLMVGALGVV
mgnify:CR=1 FL=1